MAPRGTLIQVSHFSLAREVNSDMKKQSVVVVAVSGRWYIRLLTGYQDFALVSFEGFLCIQQLYTVRK